MITPRQLAAAKLYSEAKTGNARAQLKLAESVASGEFPTQIAPLVRRRLIEVYNETPNQHQNFTQRQTVLRIDTDEQVNVAQFNDQSNIPGSNMGDTFVPGGLPSIGRREKYPTIGMSASGKTIRARKLGEAFNIDWEAIINSRGAEINLLDSAINAFGRHARQSEDIDVAKLLVNANGFATNAGQGLENAQHISGNPDLSDPVKFFDVLNQLLQTTIEGIQVDYSDFVLLTSIPYAPYARRMLDSRTIRQIPARTGTDSASVGVEYEQQLDFGANITVVGWRWLRTIWPNIGNGWVLVPKPLAGDLPILTSNYLQGYEVPSYFVKDSNMLNYNGGAEVDPLTQGDFDSDGIETKVRHVHGANALWTNAIGYSTGANA